MKNLFVGVLGFVLFVGLILGLRFANLHIEKFFAPKEQSVKRQVFEETKSYVHGVLQDLGKYYDEYNKADKQEKQIIANVIKQRFAEFDANNIKSFVLRQWFVSVRGY